MTEPVTEATKQPRKVRAPRLDLGQKIKMDLSGFWKYSIDRETIRIKKDVLKLPKPWTEDEVFLKNKFCNIFREHDRTTKWFRENIRDPLKDSPGVLFATVAFRWFNRWQTGEIIQDLLLEPPTSWETFETTVRSRLVGVKPIITGSYMIKTPTGLNKSDGVISNIKNFWGVTTEPKSLKDMHTFIKGKPFMGSFMAYEVVTDLRHTYLCREAEDINTWAAAGPGAARGLARIIGKPLDYFSHYSHLDQITMCSLMEQILQDSITSWPTEWSGWEMRDVEHTLCEYDKYLRCQSGQGKTKQKYEGGVCEKNNS